jgi:DNA polymerase III epsilon subunit-like protein
MNKKILFFDTETTGNTTDDVICQLAYKSGNEIFCELYKPAIKIPAEASAVHHITNKMVTDKLPFKENDSYVPLKELFENPQTLSVAHNAKFDLGMLAKEEIVPSQTVCTLRVARYLDKENKLSRYNLQFLRYHLDMEIDAQAHDARGDVLVLEQLFGRLVEAMKKELGTESLEEVYIKMINVSSKPSLMHAFNFGKHIGKKVSEVAQIDPGYLDWMLKQKLQNEVEDEDWIYTLKHYLGK